MERLESLCRVLGSSYEDKLEDLGIVPGQAVDEETGKSLDKQIEILEATKASRFKKMKELGLKLTELWKFLNTPSRKIMDFVEVFACIDAASSDELTHEKMLSVALIDKVEKEIDALECLKVQKLKSKYLSERKKLLKLIKQNRQMPSEFKFDPKTKVESDFPSATAHLKDVIKEVKIQAVRRKEIVMRTQVVLQAMYSLPVMTTERLIQSLQNLIVPQQNFLFDGKDITLMLIDMQAKIKLSTAHLPPIKRTSARLSDRDNSQGGTKEIPAPPYPSGLRSELRTPRKEAWVKGR